MYHPPKFLFTLYNSFNVKGLEGLCCCYQKWRYFIIQGLHLQKLYFIFYLSYKSTNVGHLISKLIWSMSAMALKKSLKAHSFLICKYSGFQSYIGKANRCNAKLFEVESSTTFKTTFEVQNFISSDLNYWCSVFKNLSLLRNFRFFGDLCKN